MLISREFSPGASQMRERHGRYHFDLPRLLRRPSRPPLARGTQRMIFRAVLTASVICVVLTATSPRADANQVIDPDIGLIELGERTFLLSTDMSARTQETEAGFLFLTRIAWLAEFVASDPVLAATSIKVEDTRNEHGEPLWLADREERLHAPPRLSVTFDRDAFDVRHLGVPLQEVPPRGTVVFLPKDEADRYFALCGYDHEIEISPVCTLNARYPPDPYLVISVRLWSLRDSLDDFGEIANRAEALVRCLDVTGTYSPSNTVREEARQPERADIEIGGACRPADTS